MDHALHIKSQSDSETELHNLCAQKSPSSDERELLEKLSRLPSPSHHIPGCMSSDRDHQSSQSENLAKEAVIVTGLDGREGQGDAIIQVIEEDSRIQATELCSGVTADTMTSTVGISKEDWAVIQNEDAKDDEYQLEGFSVIPATDSSSCSSYIAVTSPYCQFPDEPSPQVSSTSLGSSCVCSDDEFIESHKLARPSRATDSLASGNPSAAVLDGPWNTRDNLDPSPAIPLEQPCDYASEPGYYCERDVYGYASPVSDEDETYFTCREDLSKRSDEVLTKVTFSDHGACVDEKQPKEMVHSPVKTKTKSAPSESSHSDEYETVTLEMNPGQTATDEVRLEHASAELADEVLRMSLDALEVSLPYNDAPTLAGVVLNTNDRGGIENESGFYDLTPESPQQMGPPTDRMINLNTMINIAETPEDTAPTPTDGLQHEIICETPMSTSSSMLLCENPAESTSRNDRDGLVVDEESDLPTSSETTHQSDGNLRKQRACVVLTTVEKKRMEMETMLSDAERAHEEFDLLRNTVNRLIQRLASENMV